MGLRKQPPPRLENISKSTSRSNARSPTSASSTSSSHRPTRLKRLASEDSIYSPDLNTSPAFDLMPLEEAQRSPVGSPTSHQPNSWPDNAGRSAHGGVGQYSQYDGTHQDSRDYSGQSFPPALIAGQHTGASENVWRSNTDNGEDLTGELPVQLQSNNPFLKPRPAEHTQELLNRNDWGRSSRATTNSEALSHSMSEILASILRVLSVWKLTTF
jgi:hypothetical protein